MNKRAKKLWITIIMKADKTVRTSDDILGDKASSGNEKGMDQQDERNYDFPLDNLTAIDKVRVQGENCQICREDEASLKSGQETKDSESKTIGIQSKGTY